MALSVSGREPIKFYFILFRSSSPDVSVNLCVLRCEPNRSFTGALH